MAATQVRLEAIKMEPKVASVGFWLEFLPELVGTVHVPFVCLQAEVHRHARVNAPQRRGSIVGACVGASSRDNEQFLLPAIKGAPAE
jgi:hypothetical protein